MSVVTSVTAVPNRVVQMWRYLLQFGQDGLERSELAHAFSPPGLGRTSQEDDEAGGVIFEEVLKESVALGLLRKTEADGREVYAAGESVPGPVGQTIPEPAIHAWIKGRLLDVLCTPSLAMDRGQAKLPLALAWLLLQDPASPLKGGESSHTRISEMFPEQENPLDLKIQARFENFIYWARYLGLCTVFGDGGNRFIIPDPTLAIFRLLPRIFSDRRECAGEEFLDRLGQACPVLERGEARARLDDLTESKELFPRPDELSKATSLAVLRLEGKGLLQLEDRSDAPKTCLLRVLSENVRRISHVRYLGGADGI